MSLTLQAAIVAIQNKADALTGVRGAPDYPPEDINVVPFAVTYMSSARHEIGSAGRMTSFFNLVTEIHVSRKDLPRDIAGVIAYADSFPAALRDDPTLGGAITAIVGPVLSLFTPMEWNSIKTIGFQFTTQVKLVQDAT